jgi:DNA-binding NtrC family response regulator
MRVLTITPESDAFRAIASEIDTVEFVLASSLSLGLSLLNQGSWGLVLLDSAIDPDLTLDLVERLVGASHRVVVVVRDEPMTNTFQALERGATDTLLWPISAADLRDTLARVGSSKAFRTRPERTSAKNDASSAHAKGSAALIGESGQMMAAVKTVARVADSTATVLLHGESGTGKELFARLLHEKSARSAAPFVALNCAAIPEALLESELFGHEKGAFTGAVGRKVGRFERAHGGTLFLDEVGDLSLGAQAKVLRALQEREVERVGGEGVLHVDVRVVAATNKDLAREVAHGRFREDLYYRLAVVVLTLPPLRERGDDIRLLAEHCVARFACTHRRATRAISREALALMAAYPWPGNVRQLYNVLERAVLLADGPVLLPAHLPVEVRTPAHGTLHGGVGAFRSVASLHTPGQGLPQYGLPSHVLQGAGLPGYGHPSQNPPAQGISGQGMSGASAHIVGTGPAEGLLPLGELERRHIAHALALTGGHLARAAELLGIHRNTLRRKLQDYAEASGHPPHHAGIQGAPTSAEQEGVVPLVFEMPALDQLS